MEYWTDVLFVFVVYIMQCFAVVVFFFGGGGGVSRATDNRKWLHLFTCPTFHTVFPHTLHLLPFLVVGLGLPPIAS